MGEAQFRPFKFQMLASFRDQGQFKGQGLPAAVLR